MEDEQEEDAEEKLVLALLAVVAEPSGPDPVDRDGEDVRDCAEDDEGEIRVDVGFAVLAFLKTYNSDVVAQIDEDKREIDEEHDDGGFATFEKFIDAGFEEHENGNIVDIFLIVGTGEVKKKK